MRTDSTVALDTATTAGWTLVSRLTGFGRVVLIGAVLGPSYFGNLFQLANQMPWIVFDLAIGALLGAILVPELVRHISTNDRAATERLAGGFLGLVLVAFSVIAAAIVVFAGPIAHLFALGITDPRIEAEFVAAARPLLWLTAPQLVGYGLAMTGQAIQHAAGHYRLPAAASILENLVVIGTLIAFAIIFGQGVDLGDLRGGEVLLLGAGSTLGVVCHAAAQWVGARRVGLSIRPRMGWKDPDIRRILRTAAPSSITAALNGARFLVMLIAANTIAGGVVAYQLALNVLNLPVALGAKPVAYALLPRLSRHHQRDEAAQFSDAYRRGIGFAALLAVPAAVAALSLGWFAAGAVSVGEMDTSDGRRLVSLALVGIAGAVLGETLQQLGVAGSYAKGDPYSPLLSQMIRVSITALGAIGSVEYLDGPLVVLGIATSMSIADLCSSSFLHLRLTRSLETSPYGLGASVGRSASAAIASFGLAGLAAWILWTESAVRGSSSRAIATLLVVLGGGVTYLLLRARMDSEVHALVAELRERKRVSHA